MMAQNDTNSRSAQLLAALSGAVVGVDSDDDVDTDEAPSFVPAKSVQTKPAPKPETAAEIMARLARGDVKVKRAEPAIVDEEEDDEEELEEEVEDDEKPRRLRTTPERLERIIGVHYGHLVASRESQGKCVDPGLTMLHAIIWGMGIVVKDGNDPEEAGLSAVLSAKAQEVFAAWYGQLFAGDTATAWLDWAIKNQRLPYEQRQRLCEAPGMGGPVAPLKAKLGDFKAEADPPPRKNGAQRKRAEERKAQPATSPPVDEKPGEPEEAFAARRESIRKRLEQATAVEVEATKIAARETASDELSAKQRQAVALLVSKTVKHLAKLRDAAELARDPHAGEMKRAAPAPKSEKPAKKKGHKQRGQ